MHYQFEFSKYNSSEYRFYNNLTSLTDGTYRYYGWANDTAGNSGESGTRTLNIDTTKPSVSITYPSNNQYLNSGTITINGTTTDATLNYTNISIYDPNGGLINSTLNYSTTWSEVLGVQKKDLYMKMQ